MLSSKCREQFEVLPLKWRLYYLIMGQHSFKMGMELGGWAFPKSNL